MKYRVIFSSIDGINRVSSTDDYKFDSIESAKAAAAKHTKANNVREGSYIITELPSHKIVSTFIFPPPPPLEGWVDVK